MGKYQENFETGRAMAGDIFSFGVSVLGFVAPVFTLFKQDGFAPFLAFAMLAFSVFLILAYLVYTYPGISSLKKVLGSLKGINSQEDFTRQFNEIDSVFQTTPILKHGWGEFCETLVKPDFQGQALSIKNTIRPSFYINAHEVEAKLHLKPLHFISNLLVGVGLLLTFVGLVAALTFVSCGISDAEHMTGALTKICAGAGSGNQLDAAIKDLLHAASLKFWTSVSGLGCSILLRIFYEIQQGRIKNLLQNINSKIEIGLQFVTPEFLAIEHLKEAQEQSAAMRRFSTDFAVSLAEKIQAGFTTALTPVNESLKGIGEKITSGIGDAVQSAAGSEMQQLAQNMGGIVASLSASRAEMDGMGTMFRTVLTEAAETLKAASGDASSRMSEQLHGVMTALAEESRKQTQMFEDSMKRLSEVMDKAAENAGERVEEAANNLASGINGVSDGVRDAATSMAERMSHLSGVLQTVEERMNAHVQTMDALTGRARETEQAMGTTSRHLSEAALPVTQASVKMATTAEQLHSSIQTAQRIISESHQGFQALAAQMVQTQQTLQTAWQGYENRFKGVDESLGKALQGIVDNVRDNVQSMEKFVREVDQRLGAAVQTFGQSISELNDTAESFEDASSNLLVATDRMSKAA
jgi:ABC-type transporter Mla subunit MlaD